jgi:hypothetical protein
VDNKPNSDFRQAVLGPVTDAEVMESIRLFGKQVIPYFHA